MSRPTLTVTMGIPASGKTTWARAQSGAILLSTDANRTDRSVNWLALKARLREAAHGHLLRGQFVIVDVCATTVATRAEWLGVARRAGAVARLAVFEVAPDVALARNVSRGRDAVPVFKMYRYVQEMADSLSAIAGESWDEIVRIDAKAAA